MDIKEFSKIVFEKSKDFGFSECELYYVKGESMSVKVFDKELNQFSNSVNHGISFRGLINNKMGYAFTEEIDENVIETLFENAKVNVELIENKDIEEIFEGAEHYEEANQYNEKLNELTVEEKRKLTFDIENYTDTLSDKIFQVSNCSVNSGEGEVFIANSKGLELVQKTNFIYVLLGVIVKDGDSTKMMYDYWYGNDISKFDYKVFCEKVVNDALKRLNATSLKSGKYDIILDREAMGSFLSSFWTIFNSKNVQDNMSLLKGKLGEKIFSEKITIIDEGINDSSDIKLAFDSEGYPTKTTVLVEDGVLKNFLYNSKTAIKDNVKSTGNGFKVSYKSTVSIGTTNFYIKNGTTDIENLKKSLNRGIIIDELSGLHSGLNTISGDFSLLASGFYVENGEIAKPVEQITIAGNFYDILKNVEDLGSDIKYDVAGNATIGSPSILIRNLDVSGE